MSDLPHRIESVSLAAWPARNSILLDGWVVRWSEGYTKRANSVTPLLPAREEPSRKIERCERIYEEAGLPPIFRLPSLEDHDALDRSLAERGYAVVDPILVLALELGGVVDSPPNPPCGTWPSTSGWISSAPSRDRRSRATARRTAASSRRSPRGGGWSRSRTKAASPPAGLRWSGASSCAGKTC